MYAAYRIDGHPISAHLLAPRVHQRWLLHGLVGDPERRQHSGGRLVAEPRIAGVHGADRRAELDAIPDLRCEHDTDRGVDRLVLVPRRPAPRRAAASPTAAASTRSRKPARSLSIGTRRGAAGRTDHGSSMTDGSPCCAAIIARSASSADPSESAAAARSIAVSTSTRREPCERAPRQPDRQLAQTSRPLPTQHLDRLGDLQRVADRGAERLGHVGDRRGGVRRRRRAIARHASTSCAASRGSAMNAPEPALTSSTIRSDAIASFFAITLAAISGIDRTVAVASRRA